MESQVCGLGVHHGYTALTQFSELWIWCPETSHLVFLILYLHCSGVCCQQKAQPDPASGPLAQLLIPQGGPIILLCAVFVNLLWETLPQTLVLLDSL